MGFFRRAGEKHALALAMTGVKLGDRLLQIGCTDASLLAAISSKVGMSGRACVIVSTDEESARALRAAERGGILLEVEKKTSLSEFPYEDAAFNLIVIDDQNGLLSSARPEWRVGILQEARRTLAPRGRIVIIERAARGGLGALLDRSAPQADPYYLHAGGAVTALKAEGFKAVRRLAERDGLSFFEGIG